MNDIDVCKYFKILHSLGDGDCLYHSIISQITEFNDVQKLREVIAEHFKTMKKFLEIETKNKTKEEIKKYEKYHFEDMKESGVWATDSEIIVASNYLDRIIFNITVINFKIKSITIIYPNNGFKILSRDDLDDNMFKMLERKKDECEDSVIFLAWNGKNHWDGLKLK